MICEYLYHVCDKYNIMREYCMLNCDTEKLNPNTNKQTNTIRECDKVLNFSVCVKNRIIERQTIKIEALISKIGQHFRINFISFQLNINYFKNMSPFWNDIASEISKNDSSYLKYKHLFAKTLDILDLYQFNRMAAILKQ